MFLLVAKKYNLTENVRQIILENKQIFINFFINRNKNDDNEVNIIHSVTTLPKDLIIFLKNYLTSIDINEETNNDILDFMYNK
jgi:hypothetical protein